MTLLLVVLRLVIVLCVVLPSVRSNEERVDSIHSRALRGAARPPHPGTLLGPPGYSLTLPGPVV